HILTIGLLAVAIAVASRGLGMGANALPEEGMPVPPTATSPFTVPVILGSVALILASAFFSGSETAFLSIHRVRLRAMAEDGALSGRMVSQMLENPGRFLTAILVGNMFVNVMIGVVIGARVERMMG